MTSLEPKKIGAFAHFAGGAGRCGARIAVQSESKVCVKSFLKTKIRRDDAGLPFD